jgi:hypothetical protein
MLASYRFTDCLVAEYHRQVWIEQAWRTSIYTKSMPVCRNRSRHDNPSATWKRCGRLSDVSVMMVCSHARFNVAQTLDRGADPASPHAGGLFCSGCLHVASHASRIPAYEKGSVHFHR